jgi:ATP synthase protein I
MDHPTHDPHDALKKLGETLDGLTPKPAPSEEPIGRAEGKAIRLVSDFAGAALAGSALGYGVDHWCETGPWGIIAGLVLGVIAGTRRLLREER